MVTTRYSDQQGSKSRQKVMRGSTSNGTGQTISKRGYPLLIGFCNNSTSSMLVLDYFDVVSRTIIIIIAGVQRQQQYCSNL